MGMKNTFDAPDPFIIRPIGMNSDYGLRMQKRIVGRK